MTRTHFEDFAVGDHIELGSLGVSRDDIVAFAQEFDPQPMHLDEDAARATLLGGLAASGWHISAVLMRLVAEHLLVGSTCMGSPGVEDNRWLAPLRPGDHVTAALDVLAVSAPASRPDRGFVTFGAELRNQDGTLLLTQRSTILFLRREPGPPAPPKPRVERESAPVPPAPPSSLASDSTHVLGALYYDDIVVGTPVALGSYTFARDTMISFAQRFDPQPFHVSDEAAARSHFGKLSASGWHTAAAWMRLHMQARTRALQGQPDAAVAGPSPGFRDLRWSRPVLVGDTLAYTTTFTDKRPVSRPGWGLVTSHNEGWNQDGVKVFEFVGLGLLPLRA